MTFKPTPEELEEVQYEAWLLSGGPAIAQRKHEDLAKASLLAMTD